MRLKILFFKLVFVMFFMTLLGCKKSTVTSSPSETGGEVKFTSGMFTQIMELREFEHKGHTYISCKVRDGISLTHAGHCKCNTDN